MQVETVLKRNGALAPSRVVLDEGFSYARLRQLCAEHKLVRVRRGWLAAPDAAPELVLAAQHSGVLTCVTQARRLGLWTTSAEQTVHLRLDPQAKRPSDQRLRLHWNKPIVPRDPHRLEDSLVDMLAMVARCLPAEDALAVWNSALNKGLTEISELQRVPFTGRAKDLLREVEPYSDSGLETYVKRRLKRFRLQIRAQIWVLGHCVDLLVGERLIVQIDGGTHVGQQRTSDIAHDARLALNGYTVMRVGYDQVMRQWPSVQDLILRAVAQGLHRA
ncbi:very-short-patch-repair endonuclease [Leucobacter exalbidus]|uniref:Very-short-patch-repair endonuclease n=1 Tax=Leucobacter exalbidus TaxID=662960 RepID=A0A940T552_9MICO|nr:DUF559 domain-containing protein [Leucobacter exalbidus]MBP1327494.1 very-short-patch-repair endonuclease [Leucobacter exalbidus]